MKRALAVLVAVGVIAGAAVVPTFAAQEATLRGEVVDSVCWIKQGARGADHRDCAQNCADGGISLALLVEGTDELVWLTSSQMMKGANEDLRPHAHHTVELTGEWAERDGAKVFTISEITHISAN